MPLLYIYIHIIYIYIYIYIYIVTITFHRCIQIKQFLTFIAITTSGTNHHRNKNMNRIIINECIKTKGPDKLNYNSVVPKNRQSEKQ